MGMTEDSNKNEEQFVEFIQDAARTYNDPAGGIPREEMWSSIVMARRQAAAARSRRRYMWAAAGMAATLAIGVAIGRYQKADGGGQMAQAPTVIVNGASGASGASAYDVATLAHLSRAEALLVSYTTPMTTSQRGVHTDSALTSWAKQMLTNTRLLLDSPMGTDVRRRRILEDLERVLVQMVQVSPAETDADVRAHVERSLDRTRMMMRLRSVQSATPVSGS
jgi:hypothetical protein